MEPLTTEISLGSQFYRVKYNRTIAICLFADISLYLQLFTYYFLAHQGFARSFGMHLANGERREWIKPIMFSGGLGSIEEQDVKKEQASAGTQEIIYT